MTMTMAGGVGGGPGTWNIYIYIYRCYDAMYDICHMNKFDSIQYDVNKSTDYMFRFTV